MTKFTKVLVLISNAVAGSVVRLLFQACKANKYSILSALSSRTQWWDLWYACYPNLQGHHTARIAPGVEMTKFTISPLCHPERGGGIYNTLTFPNLLGHHTARSLLRSRWQSLRSFHFVIPNAVVGSIARLLFQTCKAITQPDLSWGRDDKVYKSSAFNSNRSGGSIVRMILQLC